MSGPPADPPIAGRPSDSDTVSRRRFDRERRAREEAEALLEAKSRELFEANENLERLVAERTAELRAALAAAEEASAMRARFLAVMSHEIRTPLAGLFGMLHLLRAAETPQGTRELIAAATHSAESLKRIVDDVLDLSALDAGRMRFETEPMDVRALVGGVVALLGPRAQAKGLALAVSIAEDVPARLLCDATRFRQVLSNLCENAVKFSETGAVALSAEMIRGPEGEALRVSVSDEGSGVPEADLPRLFTDFGQLDAGLAKRVEGTGLGLSICRRIVEGLGGRIGVDSVVGQGSTFWFEIPARPAADGSAAAEPSAEHAVRRLPSLAGRRILVAEDNPITREVIGGYLKLRDASHDFAVDGAEAVRRADGVRYDLIVMDVAMPEMDGVSATIAIRAGDGLSRAAPIVGFSAHVTRSIQADCLAAGMAEVLAKPIGFEEFADKLARHVAGAVNSAAQDDASRPAAAPSRQGRAVGRPAASPELVADFRRDAAERIALMRAAISAGDVAAVEAEAHRIRGAAGLLGASAAHEVATAIEEGARHLDPEDLREAAEELWTAILTFGG